MSIREELEGRGFVLDEGCLIDGPFIPDGTVRIYATDDPFHVVAQGETVAEAYEAYKLREESS